LVFAQIRASRKNTGLPRIRINPSEKIPQELKELYRYLSGALVEAHESFLALEKLYMNKDVVASMNSTAPEFFFLLQELLTHNTFLCIARLTDKPEVGRRENLTLSRLVLELSDQKYSELRSRLDEKCKRIEELSDPVRLYRHKLLAHADKVERLKENTDLGEKIPIKLVRELLEQIADFLNTFDFEFTNAETDYPSLVRDYRDVTEDLIAYLRKNAARGC
jgi:AbiU2